MRTGQVWLPAVGSGSKVDWPRRPEQSCLHREARGSRKSLGGEHRRAGRVNRVQREEACEVSTEVGSEEGVDDSVKNGFSRKMWAAARLQRIDRGGDI